MTEKKFDVVISGISGRFPECDDIPSYKKMLYNKESPITTDNRKWPLDYKYKFEPVPCSIGKYTDIRRFDARVFAVNPILAECTDVINRKVLEPSFEAILDAGINPASLMGANVGCYMTCAINETESIKTFTRNDGKMYLVGSSKSMESNRVSFALNLTGPSHTFYSSIVGGLEALSTAYKNIIEGRIDAAIVGGSSSIIDPKLSVNFMKMGWLSPDGLCRAFSNDSNGYGRSEAVVCMYLQRAEDAKRIYGSLLFSESYYLGSNPHTYLGYEEDVIEKTLDTIYSLHEDVKPEDVSFVEMDACGIEKLEKIESNAIAKMFCKNRENPLLIGSVKSHVGHTESSASYMSILKAILALDTGYIAPNMNFTEPNPELKPIVEGKLKVVTETTKLPGSTIAVNSHGINGAVGHAVFKLHPKAEKKPSDAGKLPRLIILCGRDENGLKDVIEKIEAMPLNVDMVALTNDVFKTPILTHMYRAYSILPTGPKPINSVEVVGGENRPVWFLFSGMGSQWNGMGNGLLDIPVFAEAIEKCDKVLKPHGVDVYKILTSDDPELFDDIVNAFVGIIAVQVALVDLLKAIGIEPDGIIGHSLGENGCAYADGCLTLEQSVLASYARGMASKEVKTIKGMMAAVGKGYHQIIDTLPEGIEVACHNSIDNCTLTGPADLVGKFVEELQQQNIFAKTVNVANVAYHSKHIAPAGPGLLRRLKEVIVKPEPRSSKWISTSVPEADWDKPIAKYCNAEYLTNNLLSSVLFEEGCKHIPDNAIVIEIAPHGLLQAILKRSLKSTITNIPLTRRSKNQEAVNFLLSAVGKMFLAGCQPDVNGLFPKIEYPVPRGTPIISHFATWDHTDDWGSIDPLQDPPISQEVIKIRINKGSEWRYLRSHKIKGQNIIPPSVYMYLTWHILSMLRNEKVGDSNIVFENIKVHKNLYITLEKYRGFKIMIQLGSGDFEILLENEKNSDNDKVIMTGNIQVPYENVKIAINENLINEMKVKITQDEFYKNLENIGYQLGKEFVNVKELAFNETECFGKITWNNNWITFLDSLMKIHMYSKKNPKKEVLYPYRLRRLLISTSVFNALEAGDDVICHKDFVTKQIWCNGLELMDFKCAPLCLNYPGIDVVNMKLQQMQFIPYSKPNLKNITEFLKLSLQIVVEKSSSMSRDSSAKLQIVDGTNSLTKTIKNILKTFEYKPKVLYPEIRQIISAPHYSDVILLIVNNFEEIEKSYSRIKNHTDQLFILVVQPFNEHAFAKPDEPFIEITREIIDNLDICLYKKILENNGHTLPIIAADNNWMAKYIPALKNQNTESLVILRNEIEQADLSIILSKRKQLSNAKFLYILDEDAPKFSIDNPLYKNQILQDLPVSILKDGQWGIYRNLKIENNTVPDDIELMDVQDFRLKTVDIMYINVDHKKMFTEYDTDRQEYEYGIEYSGILDNGKRIMGLGYYNPYEPFQEPDSLFTWNIPKHWSLEDGSTIPLHYIQIYQCLFGIPVRKETESVFINASFPLTEACISVCLNKNIKVYATVANDTEVDLFKKRFPTLNEKCLFSRNDCKYDVKLKYLTDKVDCDVVINSFCNEEHMNTTIECIKFFGQYIQITDGNFNDDLKLGLSVFLKSVAFSLLPSNITHLLRLPTESKKFLRSCIEEGIKNGEIQPLLRNVANNEESFGNRRNDQVENKKKIYKCYSTEDILNDNPRVKLKCDDSRSFLIVSSGKKSNLWFELLEWLINHGAKKFIVALDNFSLGPKLSHQINRLLVQKKTTIILTSFKKTETIQEASNLIKEANNIAPLEAVFFVSLDPAGSIVHNMDLASRSMNPFQFVCLFSGGLKECEQRRQANLPAILIHSEKTVNKLSSYLPRIELLLTKGTGIYSPTLYDLVEKTNKKNKESLSIRLSNYLPSSLEILENIGYHATDIAEFVEVVSLSVPYTNTKGVYPIFVIPSIDSDQMKPLTRNLFYPTFCATFTERCESASKMASELKKSLQKIQPHGPVTLIGETWSGSIAIELASQLQTAKRAVQLFLIEGSPATWQKHIKLMGEINTPRFDSNLLKQILHFDPLVKTISDNFSMELSWKETSEKYVDFLKCSDRDMKSVFKAINGIRNRLLMANEYAPKGELLKSLILFKQRPSESSLDKYCLSDEIYLIEEEKYDEFLNRKELITIINDNALFSWWQ